MLYVITKDALSLGSGFSLAVPDNGHRTIVDQGPPVRAGLRKRRRGKIIGHLRPSARRVVEFINTGSRESEMELDGLVRNAGAAKIMPVYSDKKSRDNPAKTIHLVLLM